jgi:DNA-binding SARP family transcriptional activator/predicted ATPase
MSRLSIHLLGSPHIEREGQPIKVSRRKAIALFAYITVTGESHRRDSLVNLLWPESDQSRGRTNLRRTLHALRRSLDGDWLMVSREEIGLNPNTEIWLDVDQLHKHLAECRTHGHPALRTCQACIAPLTAAVGLYRGDFMSGFSLKDSSNFDEWQSHVTEGLRREYSDALKRLVDIYSNQEAFDFAINFAKQWLSLDPLNEVAHCRLMQLYNLSGQRAAVLQQYDDCVKVLQDELGLSPQSSTTALYENIINEGASVPERFSSWSYLETGQIKRFEPISPLLALVNQAKVIEENSNSIFVARENELEKLNNYLNLSLDGRGMPVFITGSAGQGKTVLIHEFARRAQSRLPNLLVASGKCYAQTGIGDPYLPFREILGVLTGDIDALWAAGAITRDHARRLWDAFPNVLENLVAASPDLVETLIPGTPLVRRAEAYFTGEMSDQKTWLHQLEKIAALKIDAPYDPNLQQTALFEQYTRLVGTLSLEWPLLLIMDDLQWVDIGSISLLFHLVRHLTGRRILILGAYRPDDLTFGRGGERHPLDALVNEFRRTYGDIDIDLSQAENRRFLEAYLDSEPNHLDEHFRDTLFRQTKGHPLFTIEFLRGMQERKDLICDEDGYWVQGKTLDWEILPTRIEAVIAERIGRLDAPLQEMLRIASVEGEVFTAEVLADILSTTQREIVEWLSNQLERQHRLVRAQEIQRFGNLRLSRYSFRHILFQNYLYHSLDPIERAYLHEAVGLALETLYGDEVQEIAVLLAHHFQQAGIEDKAISYLFQAGEKAKRRSANESAIAHLTLGLELLEKSADTPERNQRALAFHIALGVPLVLTKGHADPDVEAAYLKARKLCEQVGDDTQYFQVLLGLRRFYLHRGELEKSHEFGKQLIALAQQMGDSAFLSRAYMMHAEILLHLGEFTQVLETSRQGLSLHNPQQSISQTNLFGNDTGIGCQIFESQALWYLGYPDQSRRIAQHAIALARELSHPFTLVFSLYFAATIFHLCQDIKTVIAYTDSLLRISQERGFALYQAWGTILQGWAVTMQGRLEAGIEQIQQGLSSFQSIGARRMPPNFLQIQVEAYRKAGRIDEGLHLLDEAQSIVKVTGERSCESELYRLQGELILTKGCREAEAEVCFLRALQIARAQKAKAWELRAATSLCNLVKRCGPMGKGHEALREIYEWYREGHNTHDLVEAEKLLSRKT